MARVMPARNGSGESYEVRELEGVLFFLGKFQLTVKQTKSTWGFWGKAIYGMKSYPVKMRGFYRINHLERSP